MMLVDKQAMLGHEPPMYLRSITTTRCPCAAKVQAATVPPVPPPRTTRVFFDSCSRAHVSSLPKNASIRILLWQVHAAALSRRHCSRGGEPIDFARSAPV